MNLLKAYNDTQRSFGDMIELSHDDLKAVSGLHRQVRYVSRHRGRPRRLHPHGRHLQITWRTATTISSAKIPTAASAAERQHRMGSPQELILFHVPHPTEIKPKRRSQATALRSCFRQVQGSS